MPPVIFIVPGLWEGPTAFEPLKEGLKSSGLMVHISALVSTGTTAAEGLTVRDDCAAIARDLASVVERAGSDGVFVFLHSAGGLLCCDSMKGLTANSFQSSNRPGGVRRIIFLSCAFGTEGFNTKPTSTMKFSENGYFTAIDPRNLLFNDMSETEAIEAIAMLQIQPAGWDGAVNYCGWREVPSLYIVLDRDKAIIREVQEEMAKLANSKVVHLDAGHMAQLTRTSEVAQIIIDATTGLL